MLAIFGTDGHFILHERIERGGLVCRLVCDDACCGKTSRLGRFQKLIISGLVLVMLSLVAFPLIPSVAVWFVLRVLVGWGQRSSLCGTAMGTNDVNGEEPGAKHILLRHVLRFGIQYRTAGHSALKYGEAVPFIILAVLFLFILLVVLFKLPNLKPEKRERGATGWTLSQKLPPGLVCIDSRVSLRLHGSRN